LIREQDVIACTVVFYKHYALMRGMREESSSRPAKKGFFSRRNGLWGRSEVSI
jgi:hypothetical protein